MTANRPAALVRGWCQETSADPAVWTPSNAAWGQCAVTALAIQAILGGDLLRGTVQDYAHYWNRLPDGRWLDLTLQQFGPCATYDLAEIKVREREYVLSYPDTAARYRLLLERMS